MSPTRRSGLLALLAGLAGGCSPAALLNSTVPRDGYRRDIGLAYGPAPRQTLDVYRPDRPAPRSCTVVFFYGGSWDSGSKDDYLFVGEALAAAGHTAIIPDYRVYPEVRFPVFVDDGATAVRWAADRSEGRPLVVMGHSAGAHIAMMLATDTPYLGRAGVDRSTLAGAIGLAGPYDFLPLTSRRLIEIFGSRDNPATQPITFARAPLPPALLIHGLDDRTVKPRNSERLAEAWKAAGARVELKLYEGVDHVDVVAAMAGLLRRRAPTRPDVEAFLATL
jgi:acetyl esterase/lipase